MRRRALLVSLALVLAPIAIPAQLAQAAQCGVWRWPVKTLSDARRRRVDFHPRRAKISKLRRLDPPNSLGESTLAL